MADASPPADPAARRARLVAALDPSAVEGAASFAFALPGPGGDAFTVRVAHGEAALEDGADPAADVRVRIDAAGFDRLVRGELDAQLAHRVGRLVVEGDMDVAQRVRPLLGF